MLLADRAILALFPLALLPGLVVAIATFMRPTLWGKFAALFGPKGMPSPWIIVGIAAVLALAVFFFVPKPLQFSLWFLLLAVAGCYALLALRLGLFVQGLYPNVYYPHVGGMIGRFGISVLAFWIVNVPLLAIVFVILTFRVKG